MTMRLPDPELLKLVGSIRTDLDTLKQAQRIGGDSLRGYLTDSGQPYDYHFVFSATTMNFLLTFTNANAKSGAIVTGFFNYSINNVNVNANYVPPWANGYYMGVQKLTPTSTTSSWKFQFTQGAVNNYDIYVKWTFTGTDTGTVTFVPT